MGEGCLKRRSCSVQQIETSDFTKEVSILDFFCLGKVVMGGDGWWWWYWG